MRGDRAVAVGTRACTTCTTTATGSGLLFEDIDGRLPPHPWLQSEADRVLDALEELTDALDPSPWPEAPQSRPSAAGTS